MTKQHTHGTPDPVESPSGDLFDRWWVWKQGRRQYTRIQPAGDGDANKRRKLRHHFRVAFRKSQQPELRKAEPTMRTLVRKSLVRAAARRAIREARVK